MNKNFAELILNRRTVRKFKPNVTVDRETLLAIIDDANKAPSFMNFQETKVIIIDNKNLLQEMVDKALVYNNTVQFETASAMMLIVSDRNFIAQHDHILTESIKLNYMDQEFAAKRKITADSMYQSGQVLDSQLAYDAGAFSMMLQLSATNRNYDTNVIGGFKKQEVAQLLNLDPDRYLIHTFIAIGIKDKEPRKVYRLSARELSEFK